MISSVRKGMETLKGLKKEHKVIFSSKKESLGGNPRLSHFSQFSQRSTHKIKKFLKWYGLFPVSLCKKGWDFFEMQRPHVLLAEGLSPDI